MPQVNAPSVPTAAPEVPATSPDRPDQHDAPATIPMGQGRPAAGAKVQVGKRKTAPAAPVAPAVDVRPGPKKKGAPAAPAAAPAKKAAVPPAGKKAAPAPAPRTAKERVGRKVNSDEPVEQRRAKVLQALKKMGATSKTKAVSAEALMGETGFTRFDVYGLLYHNNKLQRDGYVAQEKAEGTRALSYYLTQKGLNFKVENLS